MLSEVPKGRSEIPLYGMPLIMEQKAAHLVRAVGSTTLQADSLSRLSSIGTQNDTVNIFYEPKRIPFNNRNDSFKKRHAELVSASDS